MIDLKQEHFAPFGSIFDTHAHYDDQAFDGCREQLLAAMFDNGVCRIINNSTDLYGSAEACLTMAERFDGCYAAIGIHPELAEKRTAVFDEQRLMSLAEHKKVVAIGEIGLDYYYSTENKAYQKEIFKKQCELAKKIGLPVIVHDREAHGDTLEILREVKPEGVVHCFSGSVEMASELVKLGLHIGIGGVVTFKNARKTVEVVSEIPIEKIVLETDAPYLSPVPYRGNICHSAYIYYTAMRVAEIKGIPVEDVLNQTLKNSNALFFKVLQ